MEFITLKRFTATDKWDDLWFRTLSPHLKLLWVYICDKCDHAGVWNPDLDHAAYLIGSGKFIPQEALTAFDGRILVLPGGRWFIKRFSMFQYGPLRAANNCQKSTERRLRELGILDLAYPSPTLAQPYMKPTGRLLDKDQVQDQEKDQEEPKANGNVVSWEFARKWMDGANKAGGEFSEQEVRRAWTGLEKNGWKYGKENPSAALENQIYFDRDRTPKPTLTRNQFDPPPGG